MKFWQRFWQSLDWKRKLFVIGACTYLTCWGLTRWQASPAVYGVWLASCLMMLAMTILVCFESDPGG